MSVPTNITVTVTVDSNGKASSSCSPDPAVIPHSNGVTNIFWAMATSSPSNTYKISSLTGLDANEFTAQGRKGSSGWRATDANNNTVETDYHYTVSVTNMVTGKTHMHDPTIKNGGADI